MVKPRLRGVPGPRARNGFLISLNVERKRRCYQDGMMKRPDDNSDSTLCAVCGQPMLRVRTIWRAFQDDLEQWECWPCGVSVKQTVRASKMMPAEPISRLSH